MELTFDPVTYLTYSLNLNLWDEYLEQFTSEFWPSTLVSKFSFLINKYYSLEVQIYSQRQTNQMYFQAWDIKSIPVTIIYTP